MTKKMTKTIMGHPAGLWVLFFTEFWERFSYYGMRAFLILYMVAGPANGGMGFKTENAASMYGWYTSGVYAACVLGGYIADQFLGQFRSVLLGGAVIALGHFTLALQGIPFFYLGLALIVVGTGLLKPNISTLVGAMYSKEDGRRDAGFSIFYMGINGGAFLGPLVAGYLAQEVGWHYGFAAAGIGMALGLVVLVTLKELLGLSVESAGNSAHVALSKNYGPLTRLEKKRFAALLVMFVFAAIFWSAFEQAGSSLTLFADRVSRNEVFGSVFPSSWYQSLNPFFILTLSPFFAWLWVKMGKKQPSGPAKFAFGLFFVGLGFLVLMPASPASLADVDNGSFIKPGPMWLVVLYFLHTVGELCLSPVGLSITSRLAPAKFAGMVMGLWFLGASAGNKIGGWIAGFFEKLPLDQLFGAVALSTFGATFVLYLLIKPLNRLIGDEK